MVGSWQGSVVAILYFSYDDKQIENFRQHHDTSIGGLKVGRDQTLDEIRYQ